MWRVLRVETALEGSFCRCRYGSPSGDVVPDTMLTLVPGTTCGCCADSVTPTPASATTTSARAIRRREDRRRRQDIEFRGKRRPPAAAAGREILTRNGRAEGLSFSSATTLYQA